jgi:hypothetical protein
MGERILASREEDMALRQEWSVDLDARSRSLADYEASLLNQRKMIEDEVARREVPVAFSGANSRRAQRRWKRAARRSLRAKSRRPLGFKRRVTSGRCA